MGSSLIPFISGCKTGDPILGFRVKGLIRAFKHYDLHIVLFPSQLQILLPTSLPEQRAEQREADSARIS